MDQHGFPESPHGDIHTPKKHSGTVHSVLLKTIVGLGAALGIGYGIYDGKVERGERERIVRSLSDDIEKEREKTANLAGRVEEGDRLHTSLSERLRLAEERVQREKERIGSLIDRASLTEQEAQALRQDLAALDAERERLSQMIMELSDRVTLSDLPKAVDMITPSTVRVEGPFGLGSGVLITDQLGRWWVLTNAHVTEQNEFRRSTDGVYHVRLYNGDDFQKPISFDAAPVILSTGLRATSDSNTLDLALLRLPPEIERDILQGKIRVSGAQLRNMLRDPLDEGESVIAVGNPFGERDSVTHGIISHRQRFGDIEPKNTFLQTDAPINPGNSGGGLFSVKKVGGKLVVELVGINTWGYRGGDGVSGSIRIDVIKSFLEDQGVPVMEEGEREAYTILHEALNRVREEVRRRVAEEQGKREEVDRIPT